jgi:hypothetical protein
VATEGAFNPIPLLVHVIAIALGLYLGWIVMDRVSPDLPADDLQPGVSSSVEPAAVAGDDPDSLLRAAKLGPALTELDDQLAAGDGISTLRIEPGAVNAETASGDGLFSPADVSPDLPERLAEEIRAIRKPVTLADIGYMDLVATAKGPRWYVQLDINRDIGPPPWTYGAPLEGEPLVAGAAPPKPVE